MLDKHTPCTSRTFLPFAPLPEVDHEMLDDIKAVALAANERYLNELIEEHSFCPFSKGGRKKGQTSRIVHYAENRDFSSLVETMLEFSKDPNMVVVQAIFPMIEVCPDSWIGFSQKLTQQINAHIGQGSDVFAVAPLHPKLSFTRQNPFTLIPLFRRAPDPTIQWVRLDGLESIYEGRSGDTIFVDTLNILEFMNKEQRTPLFDRIAETNMAMAKRLGIDNVEESLAKLSAETRKKYTNIYLGGGKGKALQESLDKGCPCAPRVIEEAPLTARPPLFAERVGPYWALALVNELQQRRPCHVRVNEIDLVVMRVCKTIHVLYGRCPHRLALLSEARVERDTLVCRQHGWDFNIESGESKGVPGESIHHFASRVEDGRVWIEASEIEEWKISNPQAFELGELIP